MFKYSIMLSNYELTNPQNKNSPSHPFFCFFYTYFTFSSPQRLTSQAVLGKLNLAPAPACLLHGLWRCSSSGIWRDAVESDTSVVKLVSTAVESSFPAIAKPQKMKVSSPYQRRDDYTRTSLATKQDLARPDLLRHNNQTSAGCITNADYSQPRLFLLARLGGEINQTHPYEASQVALWSMVGKPKKTQQPGRDNDDLLVYSFRSK